MDNPEPPPDTNPGVMEKLTILLEQARRGEVTSFVGLSFMWTGAVNQWSVLTRAEDHAHVMDALESLKQLHEEGDPP